MEYVNTHVMNLANSIIGVSILAMPYCFHQCGIILSILMLLISSVISRLACHFLLKSAIISRRKTFEFLAFHIFGSLGKLAIEIGIIGFLLGTCIAFFVVMGDLGPEIISEMTGATTSNTMRTSILMALALFGVLPLGLLRNVDSLSGVSKATIGFYCCLVLKVIIEALPHILKGDWYHSINLWRPQGILQCLPIFSMALFCQTQLFEIYQAIPNATLEKMNNLVRVAVNICTSVYIFVGIFGYLAFSSKLFSGNILLNFEPSFITYFMKIGFIVAVAFSFPLVIFPCRASLYSLMYKEGYSIHEGVSNYIPEGKFKALTMFIVFLSLIVGILIPNIELVLGLVGSTIGVMICVLFPVTCFICISPKNTNERLLAQFMLMIGIFVMVLGTYENLHKVDEFKPSIVTINSKLIQKQNLNIYTEMNILKHQTTLLVHTQNQEGIKSSKVTEIPGVKEIRHEPPQPIEPVEENRKDNKNKIDSDNQDDANSKVNEKEKLLFIEQKIVKTTFNNTRNDQVDIEAIKKEEKEVELQEKEKSVEVNNNQILIDTIRKQNEVQKEIVEQQKKLMEVIKSQQVQDSPNKVDKVKEEKLKAVKEIQNIALKAIEKISGNENNEEDPKSPSNLSKVSKNDKQEINSLIHENKMVENSNSKVPDLIIKQNNIKLTEQEVKNENNVKNNNNLSDINPHLNSSMILQNILNPIDHSVQNNKINATYNSTISKNNNTAPLFLKLGSLGVEKNDKKIEPLPIAVSNNSKNGKHNNEQTFHLNKTVLPNEKLNNPEIQVRDILQFDKN